MKQLFLAIKFYLKRFSDNSNAKSDVAQLDDTYKYFFILINEIIFSNVKIKKE